MEKEKKMPPFEAKQVKIFSAYSKTKKLKYEMFTYAGAFMVNVIETGYTFGVFNIKTLEEAFKILFENGLNTRTNEIYLDETSQYKS